MGETKNRFYGIDILMKGISKIQAYKIIIDLEKLIDIGKYLHPYDRRCV